MEENGYVSILKDSIKMKQKEWIFVKYRMGVNKNITWYDGLRMSIKTETKEKRMKKNLEQSWIKRETKIINIW